MELLALLALSQILDGRLQLPVMCRVMGDTKIYHTEAVGFLLAQIISQFKSMAGHPVHIAVELPSRPGLPIRVNAAV